MVEVFDGKIWVVDEGCVLIDWYDLYSYVVVFVVDFVVDGIQINDFMFDWDGSLWIVFICDGIWWICYFECLGGVSILVMDIYK